ncbi:sensor histidine kinase [Phytomonospora endophytica]|uniref:histidine kinase n=1 Tax=Phytomonospora endophytica TaxID=714109 RepID=A0A841F9N2_9ACTN|nr:sensor histidine kinase [Phytomonospora endophytica]MBB6033911.1 signal transduction histidine kinase [Phytomonospora endophytica]GIG64567.1 histidine kinase [Phytomonospora endophytica]
MSPVRALGRCVLRSWLLIAAWAVGAVVVLAVLLLPVGLGLLLLPASAARLRALSDRARVWARPVREPPPLNPDRNLTRRRQAGAIIGAESFWRDLVWAAIEPAVGGALVALPQSLVLFGVFGAFVQPFIWRAIDDGNWYAFIPVNSTPTMLAALALGLAFIAAGLRLAEPALRLHGRWTRLLLAAPRSAQLARRVEQLTGTRTDALDAQAAELRRIERDLHDGAQARLIALGMTLDNATRLLDTDPEAARGLLLDVRATSSRALADLRDLVHGIHPPVLADRGLVDAVRSLALDSFLDVEVRADLEGRLPAPLESAAYFAVSEALANAAKHSGGRNVTVAMTHDGEILRVTVTDDGHGGAALDGGTGLSGVRRRLGTFDGTLVLQSPPGGPTTVTMEIPCASSSPKTSSC